MLYTNTAFGTGSYESKCAAPVTGFFNTISALRSSVASDCCRIDQCRDWVSYVVALTADMNSSDGPRAGVEDGEYERQVSGRKWRCPQRGEMSGSLTPSRQADRLLPAPNGTFSHRRFRCRITCIKDAILHSDFRGFATDG